MALEIKELFAPVDAAAYPVDADDVKLELIHKNNLIGDRSMTANIGAAAIAQAALLTKSFTRMAAEIETAEVRLQAVCPPSLLENARISIERIHLTSGLSYLDSLRRVTSELVEKGKLPRG